MGLGLQDWVPMRPLGNPGWSWLPRVQLCGRGQRLHTVVSSTTTAPNQDSNQDSNPESPCPGRATRSQVQEDFTSPSPDIFYWVRGTAERPPTPPQDQLSPKAGLALLAMDLTQDSGTKDNTIPQCTEYDKNTCLKATENLPASSKERTAVIGNSQWEVLGVDLLFD